jgi:hypothetical protein
MGEISFVSSTKSRGLSKERRCQPRLITPLLSSVGGIDAHLQSQPPSALSQSGRRRVQAHERTLGVLFGALIGAEHGEDEPIQVNRADG